MDKVGDHAVVLGASMAGLLAARVLSEFYDRVTIVERDELPAIGGQRRGVPQGRHLHGLLSSGYQVLNELFDGFGAELQVAGAALGDAQEKLRLYLDGHRYCQAPIGLSGLGVSRPLLEGQVRARVRALSAVTLLEQCAGVGFATSDDGRRITGLRVLPRADGATEQTLFADLVVDASGRGSRTPVWLELLGYPRPSRDEVRIGLAYTSRRYRLDPCALDGDIVVLTNGTLLPDGTPSGQYVGGMQLQEHGTAIVTLGGYLGRHAPTDPAGFLAFAAGMPAEVHEAIHDAEPLGDPVRQTFPTSVRHRYEHLRRFPDGLLVLGDAMCSFNPIYGQGMSVAALESLALRECLGVGAHRLAPRFFRAAGKIVDGAWDITVTGDLRVPGVQGRRTLRRRLINLCLSRVHPAAAIDPIVAAAFLRVQNLLDPPRRLLRPAIALRILRAHRGRRTARPPATAGSPRPVLPASSRPTAWESLRQAAQHGAGAGRD
ncbi:MAG: FAD-dependent oxidoreductase, partial [Pseudonocardiaceae bacterium]